MKSVSSEFCDYQKLLLWGIFYDLQRPKLFFCISFCSQWTTFNVLILYKDLSWFFKVEYYCNLVHNNTKLYLFTFWYTGVYLNRYPDVVYKRPFDDKDEGYLIVFNIIKVIVIYDESTSTVILTWDIISIALLVTPTMKKPFESINHFFASDSFYSESFVTSLYDYHVYFFWLLSVFMVCWVSCLVSIHNNLTTNDLFLFYDTSSLVCCPNPH